MVCFVFLFCSQGWGVVWPALTFFCPVPPCCAAAAAGCEGEGTQITITSFSTPTLPGAFPGKPGVPPADPAFLVSIRTVQQRTSTFTRGLVAVVAVCVLCRSNSCSGQTASRAWTCTPRSHGEFSCPDAGWGPHYNSSRRAEVRVQAGCDHRTLFGCLAQAVGQPVQWQRLLVELQ